MSKYELKVTQEYSDHVIVEAESEAHAKCKAEDLVYEGKVDVVNGRGVRGNYREYDFKVESLYPTNDESTVKEG